jgi:D-alanyl-D-alanine carboxypeptidase
VWNNSFLIRLILLWLCISVLDPAQAQSKFQTEKVDAYVREKMAVLHIPGLSLAVVRDGKVVLAKGYGTANLELSVPATENTVYHLASITKTFTAMAAMMLVEEGKILLEDPISKHLLDLPKAWRPVTVRQLLNHTSGISSFTNHQKIPCPVGKSERDYMRADVLKEVACLPLEFVPGERWAYGDTGYHLLGMLIEKVTGADYEQFLRARIFSPLEMRNTRLNSYTELLPHRANGYSLRDDKFHNAPLLPPFEFANAGIVSTVLDMAKLDAALGTEKLLKRATLEQMWTNARLNSGEIVTPYGLGFGLTPYRGRKRIGHSGGGGMGFSTAFTRFSEEKVAVIILSNADQESFSISNMANEIASFYFPR